MSGYILVLGYRESVFMQLLEIVSPVKNNLYFQRPNRCPYMLSPFRTRYPSEASISIILTRLLHIFSTIDCYLIIKACKTQGLSNPFQGGLIHETFEKSSDRGLKFQRVEHGRPAR
jgi:hypothetical protein